MIDNVSAEFDAGRVTVEHIEQMLALVYPDDEVARDDRRQRVMPDGKIIKFQLVALNKQAADARRQQRSQPAEPAVPEKFLIDVPEEVDENRGPDYVPEIKNRLGILAGVRMFGKPQGEIRARGSEGIKVRCPFSHHVDNRPSAWVNTDKNTWYCGKCQVGGDVIDFYAAAKHDLEPEQFHRSPEFRTITEEMAEALSIEVHTPIDTSSWASPLPDTPEDEPEIEPPPVVDEGIEVADDDRDADPVVAEQELYRQEPVVPPSPEASEPVTISTDDMVRGIVPPDELIEHDLDLLRDTPRYEWSRLNILEGTFLYSWMRQHEKDFPWVAPEYLLMLGLQAVGIAAGHNIVSTTGGLGIRGNLMLLLIGPSGFGKSTAAARLKKLLTQDGPLFDSDLGTGVKLLASSGSPEALLVNMKTSIEDPTTGTTTIEVPTNAWLFEDEFATLISRTRRKGGEAMKQRLMAFYDFVKDSENPEIVVRDHSMGAGYREVHDSYFSACFLTQTQSIRTLTSREDLVSGFLPRIVPVFGVQRTPQSFSSRFVVDPDPEYNRLYRDVWNKCGEGATIGNPIELEFTDEALALTDTHPFYAQARKLTNEKLGGSPVYSRLVHLAFRIALDLAINEHVPQVTNTTLAGCQVDVRHLAGAIDLVWKFVQPGYAALVEAVAMDEVYELADEIVAYAQGFLDKHGRWPDVTTVKSRSFWRKYSSGIQLQAWQHLDFSRSVAIVKLQSLNKDSSDIVIVTKGEWTAFADKNGKTFKSENFYDQYRRSKNK